MGFLAGQIIYIFIVLIWLMCQGCSHWTPKQKALAVASIGASYADYRTTHHNLNLGHEHTELNPILGSRPSNGSLAVYFISTELLILILADTFPEYRDEILTLKTSVNLGFAIHNYGETRSK